MIVDNEDSERTVVCQVSTDEADSLRSLLTKKEADMKEMEDKYKKYLEKAKAVSGHGSLLKHRSQHALH